MLLLACIPLLLSMRHDFHVCITEVNHNAQTQSLEITFKLFTDDIERSMRALSGKELRLGDAHETENADLLLMEYLVHRFSLTVNGEPTKYVWVGKEVELDATWCYVEVPHILHVSDIEITSRILTEIFEDQANVIYLTANGVSQSLYLNRKTLSGRVSL